jgi:hypothetical protein
VKEIEKRNIWVLWWKLLLKCCKHVLFHLSWYQHGLVDWKQEFVYSIIIIIICVIIYMANSKSRTYNYRWLWTNYVVKVMWQIMQHLLHVRTTSSYSFRLFPRVTTVPPLKRHQSVDLGMPEPLQYQNLTEFTKLHDIQWILFTLCVQTGSGAHPASCTVGTGGPFLRG